eukprot:5978302-Karenia_brevis.AAC.1
MNGRDYYMRDDPPIVPHAEDPGVRRCGGHLISYQHETMSTLCYDASCHTYTSPLGYNHTIDYISVPNVYNHVSKEIGVVDDFDCRFDADSRHFPVLLR